jgi:hypothetical protein
MIVPRYSSDTIRVTSTFSLTACNFIYTYLLFYKRSLILCYTIWCYESLQPPADAFVNCNALEPILSVRINAFSSASRLQEKFILLVLPTPLTQDYFFSKVS